MLARAVLDDDIRNDFEQGNVLEASDIILVLLVLSVVSSSCSSIGTSGTM